jgi:hypothetical protein
MWPFSKKENKPFAPLSVLPSKESSLTRSDRSPLSAPFSEPLSEPVLPLVSAYEDEDNRGLAPLTDSSVFGDLSTSATAETGSSAGSSSNSRSADSEDAGS